MFSVTTILLALTVQAGDPIAQENRLGDESRRLVFSNLYGMHWSVASPVPSGEISLFLGSSLRPRTSRRGGVWRTALGYEIGLAAGGADRATAFLSWGGHYGTVYHRHHLSALGYGGPHGRLFYQIGGGLNIWRTTPIALEVNTRLGVVLGAKRSGPVRGVVGGQARLVMILDGVPLPHFGIFAGLFLF